MAVLEVLALKCLEEVVMYDFISSAFAAGIDYVSIALTIVTKLRSNLRATSIHLQNPTMA